MRLGIFAVAAWFMPQHVSTLVLQKGWYDLPIIAAHHKTGSTLAYDIRHACLDRVGRNAMRVEPHWEYLLNETTPPSYLAVHFMRDLHDLVVSAYLYHRGTGEDWSHYPGSAAEVIAFTGSLNEFDRLGANPLKGESYTDFLQRVPANAGIFAELLRIQHGVVFKFESLHSKINKDKGLDEIEFAMSVCREMGANCTTVCVEDLVAEYGTTWKKVFEFIGFKEADVDWECMQSFDYDHAVAGHSDHITSNTSPQVRGELRKLVAHFDEDRLDSRLRNLSSSNPCDKPDS